VELPGDLLRLLPHPYQALGAPYGAGPGPFRLRQGVILRLQRADQLLADRHPGWRLAIFDAWRPVAVQRFMVAHAIRSECLARGVDPDDDGPQRARVEAEVGRFWAPPSEDPSTPPPHSTGAAVDLTIAAAAGPLEMGGEIDAVGPISEPDHYAAKARRHPDSPEAVWHRRRRSLADVMAAAGFAVHPNEWWHFSYGDQLWAWRLGRPAAFYGSMR
jgi:D-alanyl-D-alanine dipeptidase